MKYVVVKSGGKQYRLSEGAVLEVDKLPAEPDQTVTFDKVLLLVSEGKISLGKPHLPNVKVTAKVLAQKKGEKIRVSKFKAKARYRRNTGFRASLTRVRIEKIESVA